MKISLDWLKKYVEIEVQAGQLADRLTMAGIEVESIESFAARYEKILVGQVIDVKKHPNAEKLTVCQVDVERETLGIVCGAPNVAPGQKVPVGLVGAVIPRNQHDPDGKPFVLQRAKIRGVESNGMICSEYELGLGDDAEGILILDEQAKVGSSLADYLGLADTIFEIGLTPNRPDCMSHVGVAREIGALLGKKVRMPTVRLKESAERTDRAASVRVENLEDCPRYTARVIKGVKVETSPSWLQDALQSVGIRPINNVVDATNFVLMELGHPLHAFDFDRLAGQAIVVKRARDGETFLTLDGKERRLRSDTLMICDAERPVAIAGVMGGANTEISDVTTNVLLESAYFNPRSVRRTSKYLALSTDASQRFERGADPNITRFAADRCCQLIQELAGGSVLKGVVDVYPRKLKPQLVKLRAQRTNDVLGTHLREKTIVQILSSLEIFPVKDSKKKKRKPEALQFQVPTFRPDLEREIDLIEEVGRIYGYDRIETKESTALRFSSQPIPVEISDLLRDLLLGEGYREIVTNSLQKESIASIGGDRFVRIMNPLSDEMAALRTNLVPGMLEVIRFNINHGRKDLKLFEIGKVFRMGSDVEKGEFFQDYIEEERVVIAQTGLADAPGWGKPERQSDFFDLKGVVEILLGKIFLDKNRFIYYSTTNTLTEYSLSIEFHGGYVGFLGKILPSTLFEFGIEEDVYVAELSVDRLKQAQLRKPIFETPPKYPPVARDLAFVVDESTPAAEVEGAIRASAGELLKRVQLFDVYKGERVGGGKKSCAYSLEFLSRDRTLTEDEVEKITQRVVRFVEEKLQAKLRS